MEPMKKLLYTITLFFFSTSVFGQGEGFENISLDSGKVLNGSKGETEYTFEYGFADLHLPVFWDTSWGGIWSSGWAISKKYDSATVVSDFARHLYCAKPYKGSGNSGTFAIGQNGSFLYRDRASKEGIVGFHIANTTYAYNSMKLGDGFAKKFGGSSGNDSDYFYCRIKTYHFGALQDSQDIYLADFRDSNNSKDYILSEWKQVNVPVLTDSISFSLFSSDNSSWGMNTPAFFAIDEIQYAVFENVKSQKNVQLQVYPNPVNDKINIRSLYNIETISVFNSTGQLMKMREGISGEIQSLNMSDLTPGMYQLSVQTAGGMASETIIVE